MISSELKRTHSNESVCDSCNYSMNECSHSNKISVGCQLFTIIRDDTKSLPRIGEWCRDCADNSAVPKYLSTKNGRPAYIFECRHCHNRYTVYKDVYDHKHIRRTKVSFNCTEAEYRVRYTKFINEFIPDASDEAKKERIEGMMKSHENEEKSYAEYKKNEVDRHMIWEADNSKKKIDQESLSRKELIEKGILKFDKKNHCLINTETGQIVSRI